MRKMPMPQFRAARWMWWPSPVCPRRKSVFFLDRARIVSYIQLITCSRVALSPSGSGSCAYGCAGAPEVVQPENGSCHGAHVNASGFAIASSTGGPQALAQVLGQLPSHFDCPVLIAQHVFPGFSDGMAKWLATVSNLPVKLAEQGSRSSGAGVSFAIGSPPEHQSKLPG